MCNCLDSFDGDEIPERVPVINLETGERLYTSVLIVTYNKKTERSVRRPSCCAWFCPWCGEKWAIPAAPAPSELQQWDHDYRRRQGEGNVGLSNEDKETDWDAIDVSIVQAMDTIKGQGEEIDRLRAALNAVYIPVAYVSSHESISGIELGPYFECGICQGIHRTDPSKIEHAARSWCAVVSAARAEGEA